MKRTACKLIFLLILASNLSGCGTIVSIADKDYSVYSGVIRDFKAIQQGGVIGVLAVIDLPLSFVLDTLMLPVTLSN
ncbi:hypothetical protein BMT54_05625 [Pasteurellaceae bacterium 15-036681]|nr:hypothetical protein BMT54_05625 [Pasteurellaceae bacterium 15-036681]